MKKNPAPFYVFAFSLFPVLSLYASNVSQASFSSFLCAAAVSLASAAVLFFLFCLLLKKKNKAAAAASLAVVFFFSYGHVHGIFYEFIADRAMNFEDLYLERFLLIAGRVVHAVLCLTGLAILVFLVSRISRSKKDYCQTTRFLNAFGFFLLLVPAVVLFTNLPQAAPAPDNAQAVPSAKKTESKPDIYYIILDGYTRQDMLMKVYDYDNAWFIEELEKLGFTIAKESKSNYAHTTLSLASSLNFDYIHDKLIPDGGFAANDRILFRLIKDNALTRFLKAAGYRYVHMNSIWSGTMSNPAADISISYEKGVFKNEFYRVFLGTTLLKVFDAMAAKELAAVHLYNFEKVPEVARIPGPTFTFAHFLLPHNPYLFGYDGQIKERVTAVHQWDHLKGGGWRQPEAYIDQLHFTSVKMLEMVKKILEGSPEPPVIIIQGDHGFNLRFTAKSKRGRETRLAILNAYYLPGAKDKLSKTITPVNSFRVVLDHYFGAGLGLLEDKSYYSLPETAYEFDE